MPTSNISNLKFQISNFSAFTLVELMISISIIAILTVAAIPSFSGFSKSQAMAQGFKSLESDLRIAQSRSLSGATAPAGATVAPKAWGINFTDGASSYIIFTCTPAQIPTDYTHYRYGDITRCDSSPYKTVLFSSSVKINGLSPISGGVLDVVFDSQNGSIYANGSQLGATIGMSYSDGSGTKTINISSSGGISEN